MKFNVYIDESGEAGIDKIRSDGVAGASPYFVMAAVVCQPTAEVLVKNALSDCRERISKKTWRHATDLKHSQKVYVARELNRLPIRFFALMSNKATLGDYKSEIRGNANKFYNKCAKYLLENVCAYLEPHMISENDLRVIFEEMNHDYDAMRRFLLRVKENPLHQSSKSLSILNPFSISTLKKGESELLDVADFVAHAVYQCANRSDHNYGIPEPRYFCELSSRFAGCRQGNPIGHGLKFIHDIDSMGLETEIVQMFRKTKVSLPSIK